MKKVLALIFLLTFLAGCENDSVHRASARMAADKEISHDMMLNAMEAQYGCPYAESAVELAQRGVPDEQKAKYICQGDNNTFTSVNEPREKGNTIIQVIVGIVLAPLIVLSIILGIKNRSTGTPILSKNAVMSIIEHAFNLIIRFKMVYILLIAAIFGLMITTNAGYEIKEKMVYREDPIKIPNFSVKTGLALNIFEYQLCIKASTLPSSTTNSSIRISKQGYGYKIKAGYLNCQLDGGFAVDRLGNDIAKKLSLLDYELLQERTVRENLSPLIAATDALAQRVANAEKQIIRRNIPEYLTCENLPTDFSGLEPEDMHEVVMKSLECSSREFVFKMSKYSGMTEKLIDDNEIKNGNRNVYMCSGDFFMHTGTDLAGIRAKYQSCVTANCNGSGSSYACGVALAKLDSVTEDKKINLLTITTSGFYEKPISYRSTKMILGTIATRFTMVEEATPPNDEDQPVASFPSSTVHGRMSYEATNNFYTQSDLIYAEKNKQEFSISKLISMLDPGNGGLFGIDKFFTCYNQPYTVTPEGFNCSDFDSESKILGNTMWASASMLTLGNKLLKPTGGRTKEKAEEVAYGAMKGGLNVLGVTKKATAFFLPFIYSEGLPVFEDVFEENFQRVMGQRSEYYAAMTCIQLSSSCSATIDTVASLLYAASVVFNFVMPLAYLFAFIAILAGYLAFIYAKGILAGPRYAIKYGSHDMRKDLDKHDSIIDIENVALKPISMFVGFYLSNMFFVVFSLIYIGNPYEFATAVLSIGVDDLLAGKVVASIVALLVIYIAFVSCGVMTWIHYIASVENRDGSVTNSDGKIQNAAELGKYAKTMTGKGLQ